MDLIRNILSHFQKNKDNKKTITINGVTIQQINNNVQQNNDTTEDNNKEYIDLEVPPPKKLKKDVIDLKNNDIPENSNISKARVSFNDEQTAVSVNNNALFTVIDLTDHLEVQNALEVGETAENTNICEARVSTDNQTAVPVNYNDNNMIIDLTDNYNSSEVQNILEVSQTADDSKISKAGVTSDKQIAISVNNEHITPENDTNKHPTSKDVIPSDDKKISVSLNNNTNKATIIDGTGNQSSNNLQNSKNVLKIGETTENSTISEDNIANDYKRTIVSINNNSSITTIDNTHKSNCNKQHTSKNKPKLVADILKENNELALINTEETTKECLREFEDILANVENELTLDREINLDDVNDLINDFTFDSNDEFQIFDTESQIPKHIIRKDVEKQIPTDVGFSYNITVESVDPDKPIEINKSNTERDTKIKTTANTGNTVVTAVNNNGNTEKDSKINTITNKPDIINTNNSNTNKNTTTDKTKDLDTISLSSDDNTNIKDPIYISDSSNSDCGYHSSDFEFITEDEAKLEGLIINNPIKKHKEFNAKPYSRRSKIKKKGKTVQAGPSKPLKVPLNGKNAQAGSRKTLGKSSTVPGYLGTASNVQTGPGNPVQMPLNIHSGPINTVQGPSYIQSEPSSSVQGPLNFQAGPTNPVQRLLNIQAGPSNPFKRPSNFLAGPSNPVQRLLNIQAGPSNHVQNPSNIQAGPSNPVQMTSKIQAGPSNAVQNPSNVQPTPNYEMYRNRYKKPFQYDTAYKTNHIEPQEDGYVDLFRGFQAGVNPMYTRENKSVTPHFSNPDRMWYQGIGFDMQMMRNSSDEEDNEFKDEANETIQKIRSEYSVENRKRRFREK